MKALPLLLLLAACHHAHELPDGASMPSDAAASIDAAAPTLPTCAVTTNFAPTSSDPVASSDLPQTTVGPVPVNVCFHLSGAGVPNPYFHVATTTMAGASSGLQLTLLGPNDEEVAKGADVIFGLDGPAASAQLSWMPASIGDIDVVLQLVATDGGAHEVVIEASFGAEFS